MPLAAAYTASKQAIEGFLALSLTNSRISHPSQACGARLCTDHELRVEHSVRVPDLIPEAYADFAAPIFEAFARPALTTREIHVAEAVWRAVNDSTGNLRFPAGPDAVALSRAA